jgi:hypothetical protein
VLSFLIDLSTLASVATDDQPYLDFLSGYSVFNIGRRSRFSEALRGKTALNTRPFLSELKSLTFAARNHWNLGFMLQGCILRLASKCTESPLQGDLEAAL